MIISVVGLGYIGLPTAAVLASRGIEVVGVDVNEQTVDTINQGNTHIVEPELDMLVRTAVQTGHLRAVPKPQKADVFIVTVPTPLKGDCIPDLSFVESAAKNIAPVLEKGNLVIVESTIPVGTTEKVVQWMKEERSDLAFPVFSGDGVVPDISVAHCPERVLPGHIIRELAENDRIIGGVTPHCGSQALEIYKLFTRAECFLTDCRTAELSKLVENSFRDVNIAFANELSLVCDKLDVNVWELIKLTNRHPRVHVLQPGPGVGGHCIAVDPWFIVDSAQDESKLIRCARQVNDRKPQFVIEKIEEAVEVTGLEISNLTIACLGLAFKPNIDDLRESPALKIALKVAQMGFAKQLLVEPNINTLPTEFMQDDVFLTEVSEAVSTADIVVLLVDHDEFKEVNVGLLSGKQVVDTRGIWQSI